MQGALLTSVMTAALSLITWTATPTRLQIHYKTIAMMSSLLLKPTVMLVQCLIILFYVQYTIATFSISYVVLYISTHF